MHTEMPGEHRRAHWASIDAEWPGIDVGGLGALRMHQKEGARKAAHQHALARDHVAT